MTKLAGNSWQEFATLGPWELAGSSNSLTAALLSKKHISFLLFNHPDGLFWKAK